jgi:hypothetical protein
MPNHIHLIIFIDDVGNDCIIPDKEIVANEKGPMQLVRTDD